MNDERFVLDEWWCCPDCGSENYHLVTGEKYLDGVSYGQTAYYHCQKCRRDFDQPRHIIIWESNE